MINLWRLINQRPRPDVRIVELKQTGGSTGKVDFSAYVANYGTQQCRAHFSAAVDGEAVQCAPEFLDLLPNAEPKRVEVIVPRERLGDLVPEFANETTLYGRTLRFATAVLGKAGATAEWREETYDSETNPQRFEIQQRVWRIGRGEETDADRRRLPPDREPDDPYDHDI
jgi:hypothetical protein